MNQIARIDESAIESPLIRYYEMCHAIAECHAVDEVKELHDKALALELYARQALNTEAERQACEVRLRAERRAGELLKGKTRAQGFRTDKLPATVAESSEYAEARQSAGINDRTARRWQQLADVPEEQFEAALRAPEKPSTTQILKNAGKGPKAESIKPMDTGALWIWGRMRDFEADGLLSRDPAEVLECMTETMQADAKRIAPIMAAWLECIE